MSVANRVIMNTGILYARMAITVLLSLYTTRVVLEALGTDDFGIFNVVGGAIAMLTFLNASMAASTQRFMSFAHGQGDKEYQREIFNVSVILHIGIAIVLLCVLEGVGYALFRYVLKISAERMQVALLVYQYAIASTIFTVFTVPYDAVITARENMLIFAIFGVIEACLKLCIALVIANSQGDRLEMYGLLIAVLSFVAWILRVIYCHNQYAECIFAPMRHFNRALFKEMNSFASWSFLGSSTSMVAHYGQGVVLNMYFGTAVNAAQGVSNQLIGQLGAFAATMLRALNPLIYKSEGSGNRELMLKATMMGSKLSFFLLAVVYIPVLLEMPFLFGLWLTNIPEYTLIFCGLYLVRNLVEQLFLTLSTSISAVGDIKKYQIFTSLLTLFPLAFSYFLFELGLPPYALYISFLIYTVFSFVLVLYFSSELLQLSISHYLRNVVYPCVAVFIISLSVSAIPLFLIEQGSMRFALVCLFTGISFFLLVWFIGLCNQERSDISALAKAAIIRFRGN